jgi:hypothetical protein
MLYTVRDAIGTLREQSFQLPTGQPPGGEAAAVDEHKGVHGRPVLTG